MKSKKYFGILLCLLVLTMSGVSTVSALPSSKEIVQNVSTETKLLSEGVKYYMRSDLTAQNGMIDTVKRPQHDQAIVIPANSENVELVVWSAGSNDRWRSATLRSTIVDFEDRNPGYKVIAGVNGDFFDIQDTFQPNNSMVSAGDVWKKDTLRGGNVIGIKADKSYVNGQMTTNDYLSLKLMSGKVTTDEYRVDVVNNMPADDNQIAVFYPQSATNLNVAGYTVYAGSYDIFRVSKSMGYVVTDPVGSFIKGTITNVTNSTNVIASIPAGQFYIVSKNAQLAEKLVANTYVKCEYALNGAWADVKNAIGTGVTLVKDGVLQAQSDNAVHPRTMLGVRADGSYVLMTVDGRQATSGANGITYIEGGALLQEMDCVQGWNLDGGGSTTSIIRDTDGVLKCMNWPSDGDERPLGNTILVVMRDPKISITEVGTRSITVEQDGAIANGTIKNIQVKLDGGDFIPMTDGKYVFTDLEKDSDYIVYYQYEIEDETGTTIHSQVNKVNLHTLGAGVPEIEKFRISTKTSTSVTFDFSILTDELTNVTAKYISYNDDHKFDVDDLTGKVTISELQTGTKYDFKLVVEYQLNEQAKTVNSTTLTYTTAAGTSTGCAMGASATAVYMALVSFAAAGAFIALRRRG